jgi:hypothetical protein
MYEKDKESAVPLIFLAILLSPAIIISFFLEKNTASKKTSRKHKLDDWKRNA